MQAVQEHNACLNSTKGTPLAKSVGVEAALSRGLLEARAHRAQRSRFEASEGERLEELLRLRAANPKALLQSLHMQPFVEVRAADLARSTLLRCAARA